MNEKIQQARLLAFEKWWESSGLSKFRETAWRAFNAALDAVEIKIPLPVNRAFHEYDMGYNEAIDHCETAIESTGLGLKVK